MLQISSNENPKNHSFHECTFLLWYRKPSSWFSLVQLLHIIWYYCCILPCFTHDGTKGMALEVVLDDLLRCCLGFSCSNLSPLSPGHLQWKIRFYVRVFSLICSASLNHQTCRTTHSMQRFFIRVIHMHMLVCITRCILSTHKSLKTDTYCICMRPQKSYDMFWDDERGGILLMVTHSSKQFSSKNWISTLLGRLDSGTC